MSWNPILKGILLYSLMFYWCSHSGKTFSISRDLWSFLAINCCLGHFLKSQDGHDDFKTRYDFPWRTENIFEWNCFETLKLRERVNYWWIEKLERNKWCSNFLGWKMMNRWKGIYFQWKLWKFFVTCRHRIIILPWQSLVSLDWHLPFHWTLTARNNFLIQKYSTVFFNSVWWEKSSTTFRCHPCVHKDSICTAYLASVSRIIIILLWCENCARSNVGTL